MRAEIRIDPHKGPGYGEIKVFDTGMEGAPEIGIRRMSDKMTFTPGGWRNGVHAFVPPEWDYANDCLTIFLSPAIVDNLAPGAEYELEIMGQGRCPLEWKGILQSNIVEDTGDAAAIHWPQGSESSSSGGNIYEGVEPTPEVMPEDDAGGMPSGVAGIADVPMDSGPKRRWGCILACAAFGAIWLAVAWYLWHGAMNAPASREGDSATFEIIPRSNEKSYVEMDETDVSASGTKNGTTDNSAGNGHKKP